MSLIDKAIAAVSPQPSAEKREATTRNARAVSRQGDWLSAVLDHHDQIRDAFTAGRAAKTAADRTAAMKALARVLNGHALAKELVLYPALGQAGAKAHAAHAYLEQTTTKAQMASGRTSRRQRRPGWTSGSTSRARCSHTCSRRRAVGSSR